LTVKQFAVFQKKPAIDWLIKNGQNKSDHLAMVICIESASGIARIFSKGGGEQFS
jgi:hypothetical protein